MIGYSKKNTENCPRKCFDEKKKQPGLKFNPGLALIGLRTTGCRCTTVKDDTDTYMHTYIHTYILTYIHTYIHTYTHTHIHTYTHTYTHKHTHTYIHTYFIA